MPRSLSLLLALACGTGGGAALAGPASLPDVSSHSAAPAQSSLAPHPVFYIAPVAAAPGAPVTDARGRLQAPRAQKASPAVLPLPPRAPPAARAEAGAPVPPGAPRGGINLDAGVPPSGVPDDYQRA